ncbi:MAG: hypothetical protein RLZZ450_4333 [Pseudomonadota bacterium]|jgi:hypothetical protein
MFKSVFGTASMLGLAGMLSFSGCSSDSNGSGVNGNGSEQNGATGGIGLALQLADGSDVSTVNYVITQNGTSVRTGTLAIGADGRATGTITGLDAGAGYVVSLNAPRTRDGGPVAACTGESASFSVLENQTVPVSVVLQCDDTSAGGNITINGQFNICPKVSSASASPSTQAVGSTIALSAAATDKDNDPLTYAWFTGATYSAATVFANTATATYTCAASGTFTLNVAAFDGDARGCRKALTTPITVTCTGTGGPVDSGAAPVDSGAAPVDSGAAPVDSGAAPVDSGAADSGPVASGWPVGSAACKTCQTTECTSYTEEAYPVLSQCSDSECQAIVACAVNNRCFTTTQDIALCYCGGTTVAQLNTCLGSSNYTAASGVCKTIIEAGAGSTLSTDILARYIDTAYATGRAGQLTTCIADKCATSCLAP